jgi:TonB-linked SusC/RagA family outer membrane protein
MTPSLLKKVLTMTKYAFYGLILQCTTMTVLLSYNGTLAQRKSMKNIYVTINVQHRAIKDVFHEIEQATGLHFAYNTINLKATDSLSITTEKKDLATLLGEIAGKTDLRFRRINDNIHVTRVEESKEPIPPVTEITQRPISGTITSSDDQSAMPGVNVVVKGTTIGTVTDANGNYTIDIPDDNAILVFSFIGYQTQEVTVGTQSVLNIALTADVTSLDEIVVIGYGSQKKSDLTGSVAIVGSNEIRKYATNDIAQLLQGRAAGVAVTSDGQPGAFPSVRIRGIGTFGDAEPLYVIDGVPIGTTPRDFNPNDVESIQVLKDASAGAVYGSRAANGVVIITTKQGKKETPLRVEYNAYYGIDKVWQHMPVTNRVQYQMLNNESQLNGGGTLAPGNDPSSPLYISNIDTDWQDVGLKTGIRQDHNLNFSGGSKTSTYNLSLDYLNNQGTFVGNGPSFNRYAIRINSTTEKGIFKIGESVYYTHSHENALTNSAAFLTGNRPPLINDLLMSIPTMPLYDPNRVGGYGGTSSNIERAIVLNIPGLNSLVKNNTDVDRIFANVYAETKLLNKNGHHINYKLNLSYDKTFARDYFFQPVLDLGFFFQSAIPRLDEGTRIYTTGLVENTITYQKNFGRHGIDILAGQMYQSGSSDVQSGHTENLSSPYYPVLDNGSNKSASGARFQNTLSSFLGRINYNYDDRYLLTATLRRDGSSRFAPSNRYGNFPSVALAWKLHNEKVFQLPEFISELKARVSYGELGNQSIGDYLYAATINPNLSYNYNGQKVTGATQTALVDPNIKWESKITSNAGFDIAFFGGKLDLTIEYYRNKTKDVLVGVPIPASTGSNGNPVVNAGSLQNTGFEFTIGYHKKTGDFTFDISANAYTLKNKVLSLGGFDEPVYGVGSKTQVGSSIGQHFGYNVEGIFQSQDEITNHAFQNAGTAPGDLKFTDQLTIDTNGDGVPDASDNVINAEDRVYLGRALPNFYYGSNFSASYKNFDLTLFVSGSTGNVINNWTYRLLMHTTDYMNYHEDALNRWTPTNTNTDVPRLVTGDPNNNGGDNNRKDWLQDGTYLRINTLSLGYKLKDNLVKGLTNSRVYITCQNLYTFQKYKGYNPDFTSGVWNPGFDAGSYPKPRTIMVGVQIGF